LVISRSSRPKITEIAIVSVVALLIQGAYVSRVCDARTRDLTELLARNETVKAARMVSGLYELGLQTIPNPESAAKKPLLVRDLRSQLRREIQALTRQVQDPLPAGASDRAINSRGVSLARLDRLNQAEAVLRLAADRDPNVEMTLANVLQGAGRYLESSEYFQRAMDRSKPLVQSALAMPGTTATPELMAAAQRLRSAFDGLAFNARMRREYQEGAGYYHQAMREFPGGDAYYNFQLGLHYASADRPADALYHFEAATRLAPKEFGPAAAKHVAVLRRDTPACLLYSK
jgi:tetratricopeptide (TPR) repeat protein